MVIDFTLLTNYGMFICKRIAGGHFVVIPDDLKERWDSDATAYNAAIDGVQSLLLAMYAAGIRMDTPEMVEAINVAIESIGNNVS